MSAAVGGAVGHNEISIIIPCHRVVGANGSLTGYAGGVDKKELSSEIRRSGYIEIFYSDKRNSDQIRSGKTKRGPDFPTASPHSKILELASNRPVNF